MTKPSLWQHLTDIPDAYILDALPPAWAADAPVEPKERRGSRVASFFLDNGWVAAVLSALVAVGLIVAIVLAGRESPAVPPVGGTAEGERTETDTDTASETDALPYTTATHDGIRYRVYIGPGTAAVAGMEVDAARDVVIPETLPTGERVTAILPKAFIKTDIRSLTLPDSIEVIGESAFRNCGRLTSADLGDGAMDIHRYAFMNCSSLSDVRLSENTKAIYDEAFTSCALTSLVLPGSIDTLGMAFNGNPLETVICLEGLHYIWDRAFRDCSSLRSIVLPKSLKHIGQEVFIHCQSLIDIHYNGTMAEWNAMEKGARWLASGSVGIIDCADGEIPFGTADIETRPVLDWSNPDDWLDRETAAFDAGEVETIAVIMAVYEDCFLVRSINSSTMQIKINGQLPDYLWVGQEVMFGYKNIYTDFENDRKEGDLVWVEELPAPEKPVIYLYPEATTEVSVKLTVNGKLTCTYPAYRDGWRVTASPDGTLTDADGMTYNYLYWEGISYTDWDWSRGFCVRGEDTAAFLEDALARLGLSRREANEFIVYWLPRMEPNPYNIIAFQTDVYTDAAKLDIVPAPDTLIRVFMTFRASDTYVDMEPQVLTAPLRTGFVAVEWGGSEE